MEDVVSNGNFYKQRIEQLQLEPRDLEEVDRRRIALEQELSQATAELGGSSAGPGGRHAAATSGSGCCSGVRRARERAGARAGRRTTRPVTRRWSAEIRALEPLALQAERLRGLADRAEPLAGPSSRRLTTRARRRPRPPPATCGPGSTGSATPSRPIARPARRRRRPSRARREAELALVRARGEVGGRGGSGGGRRSAGGPSGPSASGRPRPPAPSSRCTRSSTAR